MAKVRIYVTDEDVGLGAFSFPVLTFYEREEELKARNPQLDDQERAAVIYFGMLADTPEPTTNKTAYYINDDISNVDTWFKYESAAKYTVLGRNYLDFVEDNSQNAFYKNLKRLQEWLAYNGLTEGIQKTLMEQKRKLQGLRAGIDASKAAAARALGLSQITEEMSEEARVEAAEAQAKAQKDYDAAIERENELNRQLDNISKGLPADYKAGEIAGFPTWGIVAGGVLLFWLGTRKGRREKK